MSIDPTLSREEYDALLAAGPLDVSGSVVPSAPAPAPTPTLTLDDILTTREVLLQREAADKAKLEAISAMSLEELRTKLIGWAVAGFPNNYVIQTLSIAPPTACSDGVSRSLTEYIEFCSGKTFADHLVGLQAMLPDITVTYSTTPPQIFVMVLKAQSS